MCTQQDLDRFYKDDENKENEGGEYYLLKMVLKISIVYEISVLVQGTYQKFSSNKFKIQKKDK